MLQNNDESIIEKEFHELKVENNCKYMNLGTTVIK